MIDLTDENVVAELLKRAVNEKGADYVYPNAEGVGNEECIYFNNDLTPSCIVGHVMFYAGFTPDEDFMHHPNEGVNVHGLNDSIIRTSPETNHMLLTAQQSQDRGIPWGRAIESAGVK